MTHEEELMDSKAVNDVPRICRNCEHPENDPGGMRHVQIDPRMTARTFAPRPAVISVTISAKAASSTS